MKTADALAGIALDRPRDVYRGPMPGRDSRELLSALVPLIPRGATLLDLGCGPRDQEEPVRSLGWRYVALDIANWRADLQGDAHALPFADNTFDAVLGYAVLEHLENPFDAATEIARVLKQEGRFCGTVSQGEPFHDSYFHHTPWGVLTVLKKAGFDVERLWPSRDTLRALAEMGRYPRAIRFLLRAIDIIHRRIPLLAPRKALAWSPRERQLDELFRAGSLCFLAKKIV